ncbi:hypothetical protein BC829DRAFT_450291 [Chytridium lagenaria]|nr:hypothetical protein BC829DRAFT_450291 [Chytridium lagenaria]
MISGFYSQCALFHIPICEENLTRFLRNQNRGRNDRSEPYLNAAECEARKITVLDPSATVGQHQRILSHNPQGHPTSSNRRPPPSREAPVSKKTPASSGSRHPGHVSNDGLSHLASSSSAPLRDSRRHTRDSSPMDEDEVVLVGYSPPTNQLKAGFEPATFEHSNGKGKEPLIEYDEVFLHPKVGDSSAYEELVGADRDRAILQRSEGRLSPLTLVTVRPRVPPPPPPRDDGPSRRLDDPTTSRHRSTSTNPREKEPGSNRFNIDAVLDLAERLKGLGMEVHISESKLKSNSTYRNEKLASFTALVDERRKYLYKTISGIRELLVDCTSELQSLLGTRQPTIRQLGDEPTYSDGALVSIRHDWNSVLIESQLKVKEAPLTPSSAPAPPRRHGMEVRLPPNHPLLRRDEQTVIDVDGESRTDTTTASVGSVSDDDDHHDPRQVAPPVPSVRRKAPRFQSSSSRVHGVEDSRHKKLDVDGITRRLTLLQYRQRRSGPLPPAPPNLSPSTDVAPNASPITCEDPAAAFPRTTLSVGDDEESPVNDGEPIAVDDDKPIRRLLLQGYLNDKYPQRTTCRSRDLVVPLRHTNFVSTPLLLRLLSLRCNCRRDNGQRECPFHPRLFHLTDLTFDAVVYSRSRRERASLDYLASHRDCLFTRADLFQFLGPGPVSTAPRHLEPPFHLELTLDPRFTTIPAPGAARAFSAPAQPPRVSTPGTPAVSSVQTSTAALVSQQQLFSPSLPAFSPLTSVSLLPVGPPRPTINPSRLIHQIIPSDDDEYVPDNADEAFDDIESEVSLTRRRRSYTLDPSFPSRSVHSNLSWIQPGPTPAASSELVDASRVIPVTTAEIHLPTFTYTSRSTMSGAGGSTSFSRSSSTASLAGSGKIKDGMNAKSAKDDMATVVLDSPQPASIYRFIAKIESILSQYVTDPTNRILLVPLTIWSTLSA